MTIAELRPYQDKTVLLQLQDGETSTVKVAFVDTEYDDIIVDMVETNRPDNYKHPNSAYAIRVSEIVSIKEVLA